MIRNGISPQNIKIDYKRLVIKYNNQIFPVVNGEVLLSNSELQPSNISTSALNNFLE